LYRTVFAYGTEPISPFTTTTRTSGKPLDFLRCMATLLNAVQRTLPRAVRPRSTLQPTRPECAFAETTSPAVRLGPLANASQPLPNRQSVAQRTTVPRRAVARCDTFTSP